MEWTPIVDCVYDADITVGTLSSDTYPITIQLKDFAGNNLKVRASILLYYSDSATGLDATDVTTDLAVTGGAGVGAGAVIPILQYYVFQLISEADGTIEVDSEDSGTDDQYLVLVMPDGRLVVSGVLTY